MTAGPCCNTNIVAGRHVVDASFPSEFNQAVELHTFVAADAGIRCDPAQISMEKIVDHTGTEPLPRVDDFIGDPELLRDELGNTNLTTAPFLPPLRWGDGFVLMLPNLKSDATDVIALADEQGSRDGAIHSTAHSEQDSRASHGALLYRGARGRARGIDAVLVCRDR